MANSDEMSKILAEKQTSRPKPLMPSFTRNFNSTTFDFAAPRGFGKRRTNKAAKKAKQKKEKRAMKIRVEVLLTNISGKILQEYFEDILTFLLSEDDEIEFIDISSQLEELLVRIVKCVQILDSPWMNGLCREICHQIIDIVKSKEATKEFILTCSYKQNDSKKSESAEAGNKILVYKKQYFDEFKKGPSISPVTSTPPISRSSSIDSIYSERSIPPSFNVFKSLSLNLILQFIKDKTQPILEFNDLTLEEAEFITSVFDSIIAGSVDKKLSVALWEVYRIFSSKYDFVVLSREKNCWRTVTIEKKPKKVDHWHQNEEKEPQEIHDDEYEWQPGSPRVQKKKQKYHTLINLLGDDFITSTLTKIIKLIKDESEASVSFIIKTKEEKWFFKNILNFCRSQKIKAVFSKGDRKLFNEILEGIDAVKNYKLKLKEYKSKRGVTEIVFHKQPLFPDRIVPETEPQSDTNSRQWYPDKVPKKPTTSNKHNMSKIANVVFKSAGPMVVDKCDAALMDAMQQHVIPENRVPDLQPRAIRKAANPVKTKPKALIIPKCSRTNQLIEALSVPVQPDKALKMMKSMGWTGGGLGSKGDGITEPLMPQITKGSGAGLGHNKSKPKTATTLLTNSNITPLAKTPKPDQSSSAKPKFRDQFIYNLNELVFTETDTKVMILDSNKKEKKKDKGFMRNTIKALAARAKLNVSKDVQPLVDLISTELKNDRSLNIIAWISSDCKHVYIKKTRNSLTPEATIANINLGLDIDENTRHLVDLYGHSFQSHRAREASENRVKIIIHFLKFIKNNEKNKIVEIGPYTLKQKNYIGLVQLGVNKREKFGHSNLEQLLSMECQKFMKYSKFKIDVEFDEQMTSFTLTKDFNTIFPFVAAKNTIGQDEDISKNGNLLEKDCVELSDTEEEFTENDQSENTESFDNNNDSIEGKNKSDDIFFEKYTRMVEKIVADSSQDSDNDILDIGDILDITDDHKQMEKDNTTTSRWKRPNVDGTAKEVVKSHENDDFDEKAKGIDDSDIKSSPKQSLVVENDDKVTNIDNKKLSPKKTVVVESVNIIPKIKEKVNLENEENDPKIRKMIKDDKVNTKKEILVHSIDSTDKELDLSVQQYDNMSLSDVSNSLNVEEDLLTSDAKSGDEKSDVDICDKPLELSFNYELKKTLNVDLKPNLDNTQTDVKIVCLTKKYISDMPKYIQGLLSLNIVLATELPLLRCHGVKNGALIYSCHTKKSFEWLKDICVTNNIILSTKEFDTMSVKINWFFEFDDKYFFNMLELYNREICTKDWTILKKEVLEHSVIFEIKMDQKSFKFILDSNLELYSGVDKVMFSIIWE